ncbi:MULTISPECIES: malto-oligosyltrehalose trehalohydrolase [unclassified Sphingomonas]|uniref:malto-oligosyltrehalose trehalohydrolase n=1 Tax=unclassified Sphingomonas TaxID=196159 RepID=UPI002866EBE5|nr:MULTISPECIES: malto-oligosyltrehalose trehalohydrolase [unclassified Sphingomonas]MDR6115887.1 maltooligosyltrehalose trehalohydrolase [Sphingomonas sp. SORGH_AS_0789]MDR6150442.1 maltooligosyltrehalose trehalohydrolase [Sphingomonas sp. SORGH_AS_0742]
MRHWGPELRDGADTRFRLWAPDRPSVTLEIDGGGEVAMIRDADGWFTGEAPAPPGTRYRFRVAPDLAVPDPASRLQSGGVHGWSVVVDPSFAWSATEWRGRPWEETVLLEVHAGTLGGFSGVRERLGAMAASGITAIELMPVNAFGGTRNWGYDGVLPYAVAEAYGSPAELKTLVDTAHSLGLSVFLDVVYNHFGPDGNYLGAYAGAFFHQDVDTPWGGAVAVDADPVHRYFVDNALMWLRDYRIDGLRFDAVHAIENDGFLDRMAAEIRAALPERHVHLVLENEKNDADRLTPGGYDAQWNDDFHNVLHVLLTGETSAYYGDFADRPAERLARCLKEGFIYQGEGSPNHDGKPRGKPSGDLPSTAFVAFLQNHDQVGNRAMGERLIRLTDRERLRAATALLLLGPQIPLLFMGEDEGSESPFLFFTDFHDELADAVREGRRREFAKFDAFADEAARARIPDPNARSTFEASVPEPGPQAGEWRALYRELLSLRHAHIVPRLKNTVGLAAEVCGPAAVKARWRMGDGATLTIAINLGDAPSPIGDEEAELIFREGERFAAWIAR